MKIEPEKDSINIVLLGSFNPQICRPSWLCKLGLISVEEQDNVTVQIQNPNIAIYAFENFQMQLLKDRFSIETSLAYDYKIYDFVIRLFSEILPHTPCTKLGINISVHYDIGSEDNRMTLGRKLAPLTPWGDWGKVLGAKSVESASGVSAITMKEMSPTDREMGHIQVTVSPSTAIKNKKTGIFVHVNDEYVLTEEQIKTEAGSAESLMVILNESYKNSVKRSKELIGIVMNMVDDV